MEEQNLGEIVYRNLGPSWGDVKIKPDRQENDGDLVEFMTV